jgi:hypothetical protein
VLLVLLVAFRCLGAAFSQELPNFQPLPALMLCSFVFFRGAKAWVLPVAGWLISNPIASMLQGYPPFSAGGGTTLAFLTVLGITALASGPLRKNSSPALLLGSGVISAVLFHLVTNTFIWAVDPTYAKTAEGLWQSLWTGRSFDSMPSWIFLRNLGAANLLFTGTFLLARRSWKPAEKVAPTLAQTR